MKSWSSTIFNCLWAYAFSMWNLQCIILNEEEIGLKYTKIDNEIRALYQGKDTFLPINRSLFALPLACILAQNPKTKEAHLIGFKATQLQLEAFHDPENLENVVNPDNQRKQKPKTKTPTPHATPTPT